MIAALIVVMLAVQSGPPYKIGNGVSQPQLLYKVEPKYSEEARTLKWQGTVTLSLVVGVDGVPSEIRVTRALGHGLDEKAIEALRQWMFKPGQKGGVPVPVIATVQMNFRLMDPWNLRNIAYVVPPGGTNPVLIHSEFPAEKPPGKGMLQLLLTIDKEGGVTEAAKTDMSLGQPIIEAAKRWRFTPATKDGVAVPARATVDIEMAGEGAMPAVLSNAPAIPPFLISKTEPAYSDEALVARLIGAVSVQVLVDAYGAVTEAKVTKGLGLGLDDSALEAVKTWRFQPGTRGGSAVPSLANVDVSFNKQSSGHYYMTRAVFNSPPDALQPVFLKCPYPTAVPNDIGSVVITMTIDERGIPRDLVIDSSRTPLDRLILSTMKEWRFKPATKGNVPLSVQAHFEVVALRVP